MEANGNEELVDTVREVQGTTYDFSARGLTGGTYNIQVGCPELCNCLHTMLCNAGFIVISVMS